jgi:hypothetical protein
VNPCQSPPDQPPGRHRCPGLLLAASELILKDQITEYDLIDNPDRLYLFGDNELRQGRGGQARVCRGHPNAVGVATKRLPDRKPETYWSDAEFDRYITIIADDLTPARLHILNGGTVVCPTAGLGTGLSELPFRAPNVFAYLRQHIIALKRLGTPPSESRTPRVLNKHHLRGPLPPTAVFCGRPSPLRNRSVIGRDGTRDEVCDQFEAWLPTQPHLMARVRVLTCYDPVCFCAPKRCHCDFILRLANPHLFGAI